MHSLVGACEEWLWMSVEWYANVDGRLVTRLGKQVVSANAESLALLHELRERTLLVRCKIPRHTMIPTAGCPLLLSLYAGITSSQETVG